MFHSYSTHIINNIHQRWTMILNAKVLHFCPVVFIGQWNDNMYLQNIKKTYESLRIKYTFENNTLWLYEYNTGNIKFCFITDILLLTAMWHCNYDLYNERLCSQKRLHQHKNMYKYRRSWRSYRLISTSENEFLCPYQNYSTVRPKL